MLNRILILLVLALTQIGCEVDYGEKNNLDILHPWNLEEVRSRLEREKREFLKIEELQVGNGAIASWRRRLKAEIEVRYAHDGKIIYKGPIVTYVGFNGASCLTTSVIASCWNGLVKPAFNLDSTAWLSVV